MPAQTIWNKTSWVYVERAFVKLKQMSAGQAPVAPAVLVGDAMGVPLMQPDNVVVTCYDRYVPAFAEPELERLYGSMFASLPLFRACGVAENASTYVEQRGGEITAVWLFRQEKNKVVVFNEGMHITDKDVCRFARHIFHDYDSVDIISLHAIDMAGSSVRYPYQRYNCLEDIVLVPPATADEYRASLGKSTRSYISRYLNKLKRDFPSFSHRVYAEKEIGPQQLIDLFQLNRARMESKGKVSIIDDAEGRRITQLARERGLLSVLTIDGKMCAGTLQYRMGNNYFMEVIGHDSAYNDYRLGTLCCYLAICECIARGAREYHLLWGQNEYKFRLGGVQRDLDHLTLYRSRWHYLLNAGEVARNAFRRNDRRLRLWAHKVERGEGKVALLVGKLLHCWRGGR